MHFIGRILWEIIELKFFKLDGLMDAKNKISYIDMILFTRDLAKLYPLKTAL